MRRDLLLHPPTKLLSQASELGDTLSSLSGAPWLLAKTAWSRLLAPHTK